MFFLIYFLVNKLTNEKKNFWLAMFYQKISLNVTFDFRDPYRPLKAVKQKNLIKSIKFFTSFIKGYQKIKKKLGSLLTPFSVD